MRAGIDGKEILLGEEENEKGGREVCDMRQGNRMKASKVEGNSFKMRGA